MSRIILLSIIFMLGAAQTAVGQTSCLPKSATYFKATVDPSLNGGFTQELLTDRDGGMKPTKAQIAGEMRELKDQTRALELTVQFDPEFDGVSLAYNVYAVMVERNGEVIFTKDFTKKCRGAGVSFYPGTKVKVGDVKLPEGELSLLKITVWGRM